jgi:hypothetical protein
MKVVFSFLFLVLSNFSVAYSSENDLFFGHNLSQTNYVLKSGQTTFGTQVIGYGLTDDLTVATSPWLIVDYSMLSLILKYKFDENRSFEFSYFKACFRKDACAKKTFDGEYVDYEKGYSMEAFWLVMIDRYTINDHYAVNVNYGLQYYANQKMPFSLKRPASDPKPWQIHVTTLNEANLFGPYFMYGEAGALIPFDNQPYIVAGVSAGYKKSNFETHLGFSLTSKYSALFNPAYRVDAQQKLKQNYKSYYSESDSLAIEDKSIFDYDYALHPEFSIQYSF